MRAQDVLLAGEEYGVNPPAWVLYRLQQDPDAFEFRRAWIQKVARVRQSRLRVQPLLGPSYGPDRLVSAGAAVTGTFRLPVLAGLYENTNAPYAQADYQTRLFGDGRGIVSLSEYYEEVSGGVFALTGVVSEWIQLAHSADYYEPDSTTHERYGRVREFINDVLVGADPSFDFSVYDNDGDDGIPNSGDDDGYVDVAAFIYPSAAMNCGGPGIWPHRSGLWNDPFITNDPSANGDFMKILDYTIQSGVTCGSLEIMGSGTISHEMGHALALPDLYDTDQDDGTVSAGIGHWGLMASGGWNEQVSPAHMSAWSKDFLGWVHVSTATGNQVGLQLFSIQESHSVVRVDVQGGNEYFLLSNRQVTGSDAYLHGGGLLVWHIDQDVIDAKRGYNRVNADANHKGVDLEEADSQEHLDYNTNRGDAGDPFPGANGSTTFDYLSDPNSLSNQGNISGLALRNISHAQGVITLDLYLAELTHFVWGDLNGDEVVDLTDVDRLYSYVLGEEGVETSNLANGDVDEDGDVDLRDCLIVHSYLHGVDTSSYRVGQIGFRAGPSAVAPER